MPEANSIVYPCRLFYESEKHTNIYRTIQCMIAFPPFWYNTHTKIMLLSHFPFWILSFISFLLALMTCSCPCSFCCLPYVQRSYFPCQPIIHLHISSLIKAITAMLLDLPCRFMTLLLLRILFLCLFSHLKSFLGEAVMCVLQKSFGYQMWSGHILGLFRGSG